MVFGCFTTLGAVDEKDRPGVKTSPLYRDANEDVRVEHWAPDTTVTLDARGGAELFVLEGGFTEGKDELRKSSWLRLPVNSMVQAETAEAGARVWIKTGHLVNR